MILHAINVLHKLLCLIKRQVNVQHVDRIMYGIPYNKNVGIKAVNKDTNLTNNFKFVC